MINVDWHSIRPLNRQQNKGFEELCSQLARNEVAGRARFIRKGDPDAGVECYAIYENGSEHGWQAKYFFTMEDAQWRQIDHSVRTAIQKHPLLERYVICLPMDLPDARITGQKSALEKWDASVDTWKACASERGMSVDFECWGSSELLERLTRPEQVGRLRFWFNTTSFDNDWFVQRLEEARQTAGPRYTPELHVDLPIAERFEAFGRTSRFFDRTIRSIRGLANAWASACSPGPSRLGKERDPEVEAWIRVVSDDRIMRTGKVSIGERIDEIVAAGSAIKVLPNGTLPFDGLAENIAAVEMIVDGVVQHILTRQGEHRVISQYRHQFETFAGNLRKVREELSEAQLWGGAAVMIVRGQAGTGKTHLLCDVAHRRLTEDRPTVLLMGQSFTSDAAPWPQVADLLDANESSAVEFVGALECAAQAAGVRALVLIDALNEGKGLKVWPTHLSGFLSHFARSDWIGVVLSIRSSYDELIPEVVRERAVVATHRGFGERSYDAMRTFFTHYGLELPSTPLIAPEFGNPLFLKTLCSGLQGQGSTRLPQGTNGITGIFDLYISSINKRVASSLGLSPRSKAAGTALRALGAAFPVVSERWLAVEAAEELVNGFLPGRAFEQSLYRILVLEGVLVEEAGRKARHGEGSEVVFIAYDRLADHLVTEALLDAHFDPSNAAAAFKMGGGLSEVAEGGYETQGILEALCIQLPERTGREVADLVPSLAQTGGFEGAFRQSLVWRDTETFTERTCELVRQRLGPDVEDRYTILGALLTLATTPDHLLNARFLDARLRQDEMAARDTWWSVYLHHSTSGGGPAQRLRDWALAVSPTMQLNGSLVDLGSISLAWMLTTSHRSVRDWTTKALVNLLTGRLEAATRLVEAFADVDDPYLVERLYAVAYGVATRSHDPDEIKPLADCVYSKVFGSGAPPANILLRDYARGVVERALYLEAPIQVDASCVRPPYSGMPLMFPSEEDVAPLLPSSEHNPYRREGEDWARSHIGQSVLEGTLHREIWETWGHSGEWLSLELDQPAWREAIKSKSANGDEARPPVLDRKQIDRYVLWRTFDLGWSTERFGGFDRTWDIDAVGGGGKESIGRKYQWIAYREVLALIADRYQYRELPTDADRSHRYQGPWQNWLRDIDPTFTTIAPRGKVRNYRQGNLGVWWTAGRFEDWEESRGLGDWLRREDDLPAIQSLLIVQSPEQDATWLNASSYFSWRQKPPVGRQLFEVERGDVAYSITAYLTSKNDAASFVEWTGGLHSIEAGIDDVTEVHEVFMGEHAWAPAATYSQVFLGGLYEEARPSNNSPVRLNSVAAKYPVRRGALDDSGWENNWIHIPDKNIVETGALRWSGMGADFLAPDGTVAVFDPSAHELGPSALLMRQDFLRELLDRNELEIVWIVVCLKSVRFLDPAPGYPLLRLSGVYRLSDTGPVGFMRSVEMQRQSLPWET